MTPAWRIVATALIVAGAALLPAAATAQTAGDATTPAQAIKKVCSACHNLEIVMDTPRDYNSWRDTVQMMIDRGASGTQEEYSLIMQFLFANMTTIDVNTDDAEALGTVLHATPDQVAAILARRAKRPFKDLSDLMAAVPGLNRTLLVGKKRMLFF
jgi:hypothetical protein